MEPSLLAGVNLPVLGGAYNHDLAPNERYPSWPCEFHPLLAYRYLVVCRSLGFRAVRLWLCEDGEGVRFDGQGRPAGPMPELLEAVRAIQDGAELLGLRLYWTLLDGNGWQRNGDAMTGRIAADPAEARRFAERVAAPIAAELRPATTVAIEAVNEPESLSAEVVGEGGLSWESIVASVRVLRGVLHEACPGVPVTCGTQAVFLPGLLADLAAGGSAPVDAVDLHVYHPNGGLPPREDLPVDIGDLPLLAGECGLSDRGTPGRNDYLLHYLHNGRSLGYSAVFLWKLEGEEHLVTTPRGGRTRFVSTPLGDGARTLLVDDWRG